MSCRPPDETIALTPKEIELLRLGLALLIGECPPDHSPVEAFTLDDRLKALQGE